MAGGGEWERKEDRTQSEAAEAVPRVDPAMGQFRVDPAARSDSSAAGSAGGAALRMRAQRIVRRSGRGLRIGAGRVVDVVVGRRRFDTEKAFVWFLRGAGLVMAGLALWVPLVWVAMAGFVGYLLNVAVNVAIGFALFSAAHVVEVIYDIRDRLEADGL